MPVHTPPPEHPHADVRDEGFRRDLVLGAVRLTPEQGLALLRGSSLVELGRLADARARVIHAGHVRTYVIDRNINYTNVCTAKCTFCAFRRDHDDADAYTLTHDTILDKIGELVAIGGTQILMQGGMNDRLPLDWYLDLLRAIKARFPKVHVHAFSPPEMVEFVHFFKPPGATFAEQVRSVLARLREAGLDSLPGGGGEIFAAPVRRKIGLGKCDAESWLTVMHEAHALGMFTSATMMFGHIEGYADRVHHMHLVRAWQDRSLARAADGYGHYTAFIAWPFQRENTPLGRVRDWGRGDGELSREFPGDVVARAFNWGANPDVDYRALGPDAAEFGRRVRMSGASDYLRTQALSRLYLDNVYSIGASWVTMGPHVGQVALRYGANDMGSVMMEENVVSSAGTTYCLDEALLCRLIRGAGFLPAQRNNTYDVLRVHDAPDSPDLRVTDWSAHRARRLHVERAPAASATLTVSAKA